MDRFKNIVNLVRNKNEGLDEIRNSCGERRYHNFQKKTKNSIIETKQTKLAGGLLYNMISSKNRQKKYESK